MAYVALSRVTHLDGMYLTDFDAQKIFCNEQVKIEVAKMTSFNLARANPLLEVDHTRYFTIAHHNIQSLRAHIEDMKSNPEMRKAHVICLQGCQVQSNVQSEIFLTSTIFLLATLVKLLPAFCSPNNTVFTDWAHFVAQK